MEAHTLIEQAVARYRCINQVSLAIEQAILKDGLENLAALCAHLHQLQEEAKIDDGGLLLLLRDREEWRDDAAIKEWLTLMRSIHERNQRLMPHVKSIMAVRRNELRTLHKGASVLQGYRSGSNQTGNRLSSSG